jgi:CRP-like cAMP-binding protein
MSDFFRYTDPAVAGPAPVDTARTILAELSTDEWEKFIAYTARRRYPAGAVVVQAGQRERALCFIASGQVEIDAEAAGRVRRGEGDVFGLLSFLDAAPSSITATVSAGGPAELLLLTPDALQQLAAWQPRIAMTLLRDLGADVAARLRRLQPGD